MNNHQIWERGVWGGEGTVAPPRQNRRFVGAICLLFFLTCNHVFAGAATATLDKTSGTLGDAFQLTVAVEGSLKGDVELPEIPNLTITSSGSSTQISWINGVYKKEVSYNFILEPQKEGSYTVPSLKLKIDGDWVSTQALTFSVGSGAANFQADQDDRLPSVFIERDFSKSSVVEGEPLISTVKIYHRVQLAGVEALGDKIPNLRILELKQTNAREQRGTYLYDVIVVKQVLIPMKSGQLHLPPFKVKASVVMPAKGRRGRSFGDIDDFFGDFFGRAQGRVVNRTISSEEAILDVDPIPTKHQPKGYKGLVGSFRLKSELSQTSLNVGDTTTLTLELDGVGALDVLGNLELDLGPNLKIYADKPQISEEASEKWGLVSKRTFKFALVPTHSGEIVLPPIVIPYYDPEKKIFETLQTLPGTLQVVGGDESLAGTNASPLSPAKTDVKALANDLVDIHRNISMDQEHGLKSADTVVIMAIVGGPAFLCLILFLFQLGANREIDLKARRRLHAFQTFRLKKTQLEREGSRKLDSQSALSRCSLLFREYVGDKFNQQGGALTAKEIETLLTESWLKQLTIKRTLDIVRELESLEYGGKSIGQDQFVAWMGKIEGVVKEIEGQC